MIDRDDIDKWWELISQQIKTGSCKLFLKSCKKKFPSNMHFSSTIDGVIN